ncbi:Acyl-CoA dehydrogenase family member 10 [Neolecta irregularis DAH-3]|uniref:Acyl-CoA dehydrogenase family member 10 n=1 Tax=Neolecta irregularis (strain DAH-3) TaxID=1198029 RepID=A0A1U7LKZ5_NEOID|nr:Acyl-CoA dehydrogenase family member 10 [Neolecta irregularis DAH-3]|eukprot:OLL23308.1 Acyl-CoA dehydrogenase family member 10 [Neolecta irregularis DAH-3]
MSSNCSTLAGIGPVRHPIDEAKLTAYLKQTVPSIALPVKLLQRKFTYGQSNPTYYLRDANTKSYVLRKKPPGTLLSKTAHAVEREYKILKALQPTNVPTPKVYSLCEDSNVIGTPFYVRNLASIKVHIEIMEFLNGRVFADPLLTGLPREERRQCWNSAIKTLVALHSLDPVSIGLLNYGKASEFYPRQLKTLTAISTVQAAVKDQDTGRPVGEIPCFKQMASWFLRNLPEERSTVIHGDFKIDNLVFHPTESIVIGILDWELSSIGHPLSDLSNLCQPYVLHRAIGGFAGAYLDGVPQLDEVLELYTRLSCWDPRPLWTFGTAFAHLRLAVICQGIAARVARKQASGAKAAVYRKAFPTLGESGWHMIMNGQMAYKPRI